MESAFLEKKFSQYLYFTVTTGSNDLITEQEYTGRQHRDYEMVESLHNGGIGYRKIAQYLNEQGSKTVRRNAWKNNPFFSIPKRYQERPTRIRNIRKYDHGMKISKLALNGLRDS